MTTKDFDVLVVGGGPAGLSAGMVLARARRRVAVVDAGQPRNAPASHVHGIFTRDGATPRELIAVGRQEVTRYGGTVLDGRALTAQHIERGFQLDLADGRALTARRLLIATGLHDELPDDIAGLRERWGRDVLHCPYCHGWEVRDEPIVVLGASHWAVHQALLFRQWSNDITLVTHNVDQLSSEELAKFSARGIRIVYGRADALLVADDHVVGVQVGAEVVPGRAVVVPSRLRAESSVLASLGVEPVPHPMGIGEHFETGPQGAASVPGVWIAGNTTDLAAQVVVAAAAGLNAATAINADLLAEDTELAMSLAQ